MQSPDEMRSQGGVPLDDLAVTGDESARREAEVPDAGAPDAGSGPPLTGQDGGTVPSAAGQDASPVPSATGTVPPEALADASPVPPATGTAPPGAFGYAGTVPESTGRDAGAVPPEPSGGPGTVPSATDPDAPLMTPDQDAAAMPPGTGTLPPEQSGGAGTAPQAADVEQRWSEIQAMFVDDPRGSVQQAADLTDAAITELVSSVRQRQTSLASAWQDSDAGTEKLRGTLRDYRAFWGMVRDMPTGDPAGAPAASTGPGDPEPGRGPAQPPQPGSQGLARDTYSPPAAR